MRLFRALVAVVVAVTVLVACGQDEDPAGFEVGPPLLGHTGPVQQVAIGELNGRAIAVSAGDTTLRVWDLATRKLVGKPLTGHTIAVTTVAVGKVGKQTIAVSGAEDWTVRVWDLATGKQVGEPLRGHRRPIQRVALAKLKGRPIIVSASGEGPYEPGELRLWDLGTRKQIGKPISENFFGYVSTLATGELKGRPIAVTGGGGQMIVWDLTTRQRMKLDWHPELIREATAVTVGQMSGRTVVVSGHRTKRLQVHDLSAGASPFTEPDDPVHDDWIYGIAVGEAGGRAIAVSASADKTLKVWDLRTGEQIGGPLTGHDEAVSAVALGTMDGGPVVVSGGTSRYVAGDFSVRVWKLKLPPPAQRQ